MKKLTILFFNSAIAMAMTDQATLLQKQIDIFKSRHALILQERSVRQSQDLMQDMAYEKQLVAMQARLKSLSPKGK